MLSKGSFKSFESIGYLFVSLSYPRNDICFLVDISELVRTLNEEFSACAYHKSLDVLIDNSG